MTGTQPGNKATSSIKHLMAGKTPYTTPLMPVEQTADEPAATCQSRQHYAFNKVVKSNLPTAALGVAITHLLLAFSYAFILIPSTVVPMIIIAGVVAMAAGALWLIIRRCDFAAKWAHPILTLLVILSLANALAYLHLSQEMRQSVLILFIVLGMAQFYLSVGWFTAVLTGVLLAWRVTALQLPESPSFFGSILLVGSVAAIIMFLVRRRALKQYEVLRRRDQNHKKELTQHANQLETSLTIGQHIIAILDLDTLLSEVVALIREQYGLDYAAIFLLDEKEQQLQVCAGTGKEGQRLCAKEATLPVDENSLVGWTAVHCRPVYIEDVTREQRYVAMKPTSNVRSELDLPLCMGTQMLGVLTLQSKQVSAFNEQDIPFLQLLSTQVAIAIYNASLYQREKAARRLAETLQDTGRALTSTLEWDAVIDLILERLEEIVTYDRASVLVQRGSELELVAARGFPPNSQPLQIRVSLEKESIYSQIYETKRPLSIPDVQKLSDWQQFDELPPARSWLGVPLNRSNEVIGMLSLVRETPRPYDDEEISQAAAFAGQAAIAIKNARIYEQTTRFTQQLEYEVRQRTEAIRKAYEELEQLNLSKSDFISIVSHELRTPVTILHGYAQMLQHDERIQADETHRRLADGIQSGAKRLDEIINSMLDVVKIDNRELKLFPAQVSLAALVRMVSDEFEEALVQRNLHFVIDESVRALPVINADPDALQKVFHHLFTNAIKYTPNGGTISVSGACWQEAPDDDLPRDAVEIVVADTGIGIDPTQRDLIFTKFFQTGEVSLHSSSKTQFKGGGPGLGLAISRGIVEAHRGCIWVESAGYDENSYPGSQFHIVLPISREITPVPVPA